MTFPVHTQQSLDKLTWNEVRVIHSALGLKATAEARTRRDYQRRIIATQPQPVAEPEQVATPLTCATCPLARHIDGDRYCCGLTDAVTRGHWEAKSDCYEEVAKAQPEAEIIEVVEIETPIALIEPAAKQTAPAFSKPRLTNHPFRYRADIFNGQHSFSSATYGLCECDSCIPVAQPTIIEPVAPDVVVTTTDDAPPNRGDNGRNRVQLTGGLVKIAAFPRTAKTDNFMSSMTEEDPLDREFYDLAYLAEQQLKAQLAVEKTVIGSEEEAIALMHLAKIDRDIEFYGRPQPEPQLSPVVVQLEKQMTELKADTLKLFKITAFDQSILPTHGEDLDEQPTTEDPEGTIHWRTPLEGTIVGKKGATRPFFIRNDEIFIVISPGFIASETKSHNVRHQQIRDAINLGKAFNPLIFKLSPDFEQNSEDYNGIGRIRQECDGRWWVFAATGITGHSFFNRELAQNYLTKIAEQHQFARQSVTFAK